MNKNLKPVPERSSSSDRPLMTKKYIREVCEYNNGYYTSNLNNILYLNCQGFKQIENLEEYYNCKVLFLDGNLLKSLTGIQHMHQMKSLFLHNNLLSKMSGLENFTELHTLSLSGNMIEKVEGLEHCSKLHKLDLTGNKLSSFESISELSSLKSLSILLLKSNQIDYDERIVEMLSEMEVKYLELKNNPFVRNCPKYRLNMISSLPTLNFLDDKPVTSEEGQVAEAFYAGGAQKVREKIEDIQKERLAALNRVDQKVRLRRQEIAREHEKKKRMMKHPNLKAWLEEQETLEEELKALKREELHLAANPPPLPSTVPAEQLLAEKEAFVARFSGWLEAPELSPLERETLRAGIEGAVNEEKPDHGPLQANLARQEEIQGKIKEIGDCLQGVAQEWEDEEETEGTQDEEDTRSQQQEERVVVTVGDGIDQLD